MDSAKPPMNNRIARNHSNCGAMECLLFETAVEFQAFLDLFSFFFVAMTKKEKAKVK